MILRKISDNGNGLQELGSSAKRMVKGGGPRAATATEATATGELRPRELRPRELRPRELRPRELRPRELRQLWAWASEGELALERLTCKFLLAYYLGK